LGGTGEDAQAADGQPPARCRQFLRVLDQHYGVFSHTIGDMTCLDDPVDYAAMPARFTGTELCANPSAEGGPRPWTIRDIAEPIRIGRTTVSAFCVYHVTTCCLAYRVEHDGRRFVFCTGATSGTL
jgi:hypothetical protein